MNQLQITILIWLLFTLFGITFVGIVYIATHLHKTNKVDVGALVTVVILMVIESFIIMKMLI